MAPCICGGDEEPQLVRYAHPICVVDRDTSMHFHGGGVGHKSTRNTTREFFEDCDPLDRIAPAAPNEVTDAESEQEEDALLTGKGLMEGDEGAAGGDDDMELDSEVDKYNYGGLE